jgi:hypothetical protein
MRRRLYVIISRCVRVDSYINVRLCFSKCLGLYPSSIYASANSARPVEGPTACASTCPWRSLAAPVSAHTCTHTRVCSDAMTSGVPMTPTQMGRAEFSFPMAAVGSRRRPKDADSTLDSEANEVKDCALYPRKRSAGHRRCTRSAGVDVTVEFVGASQEVTDMAGYRRRKLGINC